MPAQRERTVTLREMGEGRVAEILSVRGDGAMAARLNSMGLYAGKRVRYVRSAPFSGPLLIEDVTNGAQLMIARSLAGRVEVRADDAQAG